MDVGVDCHGSKPISYSELKRVLSKRQFKEVDKHKEGGGGDLTKNTPLLFNQKNIVLRYKIRIMGKKDLKKQYPSLDVSLIDYLSKNDPSGSNKYLPFMLKVLSKGMEDYSKFTLASDPSEIGVNNITRLDDAFYGTVCSLLNLDKPFKILNDFHQHLTENRVDNPDITSYNTFEDLLAEKNKADIRFIEKDLQDEVERVYEDDTWLAVKPLSFRASKIYGSNTKWCTTMAQDPMYFYKYSKGILIYVINKKDNNKYGFYSGDDEYSVWNAADIRIDSLLTEIPFDILKVLQNSLDLSKNVRNRFLFSESETKIYSEYFGGKELKKMSEILGGQDMANTAELTWTVQMPQPEPDVYVGEEEMVMYDVMEMSEEEMLSEYPEIEEWGGSYEQIDEGPMIMSEAPLRG